MLVTLRALLSCGSDSVRDPPPGAPAATGETGETTATTRGETGDSGGVPACVPEPDPPPTACAPAGAPFAHCGCVQTVIGVEGGEFGTVAHGLAPMPDGGIVVGGSVGGRVTFGAGEPCETVLDPAGPYVDGFVARYTAGGKLVWVRQHENTIDSTTDAVATDASGRVAAAGIYWSDALTLSDGRAEVELPYTFGEAYVVTYDADGRLLWAVSLTSADGREYVEGLAFGPDGELYVAGWTEASSLTATSTTGSVLARDGLGPVAPGETSGFLLRVEPDGEVAWIRAFLGTGVEALRVGFAGDGTVVTAGAFFDELHPDPGGTAGRSLRSDLFGTFHVAYDPSGALVRADHVDASGAEDVGGIVPRGAGYRLVGLFGHDATWAPGTPQETVLALDSGAAGTFSGGVLEGVDVFYVQDTSVAPGRIAIEEAASSASGAFAVAGLQLDMATYDRGGPREVTVDADPTDVNAWDPLLLVFEPDGALDCFWHLDGAETFDQARAVAFDHDGSGVWIGGAFERTLTLAQGRPDARTLTADPVGIDELFVVRFSLRP